jgi:hypothetical protein
MSVQSIERPSKLSPWSNFVNNREPRYILARAGLYLATTVPATFGAAYGFELISPHESSVQDQVNTYNLQINQTRQDYSQSRYPQIRAVLNEKIKLIQEDRRPYLDTLNKETSSRRLFGGLSLLALLGSFLLKDTFITGKRYNKNGQLE